MIGITISPFRKRRSFLTYTREQQTTAATPTTRPTPPPPPPPSYNLRNGFNKSQPITDQFEKLSANSQLNLVQILMQAYWSIRSELMLVSLG